jgi:hypothetical protein
VWLPESVGFDVRDCTDLQNRGFSDDPGLGQTINRGHGTRFVFVCVLSLRRNTR